MTQFAHTDRRPTPRRWLLLGAVALLLIVVISGCGGGNAASSKPMSASDFQKLGEEMQRLEGVTPGTEGLESALTKEYNALKEDATDKDAETRGRALFLQGYIIEILATRLDSPLGKDYDKANDLYQQALRAGGTMAPQAAYRSSLLSTLKLYGMPEETSKTAKSMLGMLRNKRSGLDQLWVRQPGVVLDSPMEPSKTELAGADGSITAVIQSGTEDKPKGPVLEAFRTSDFALRRLDYVYRTGGGWDALFYQAAGTVIGFFTRLWPAGGLVLALFALALLVKLITAPLTTMAYRGMRDMQKIQPLLKELQEKYPNPEDRAKMAEEQMRIMKEHNVSMTGGCFPMLIQLPIFLIVYQAVMVYSYQFHQQSFLWVASLAKPDWALLILYALSMIVTQKLNPTQSTDPQQQMTQNIMTFFMPVFLLMVLKDFASAFVLYWFFLNVLSTIQQYYLIRHFKRQDEAAAAAAPAVPESRPSDRRKKGK